MSFRVRVLQTAEREVDDIVEWIAVRRQSPSGAESWLNAYEEALQRLADAADSFGPAPEDEYVSLDVKQVLFRTRRGKTYRAVFTIEGNEARVLHVRGPGQSLLTSDELGGE
jgi:plasmid stabilization system protein ParE